MIAMKARSILGLDRYATRLGSAYAPFTSRTRAPSAFMRRVSSRLRDR